MNLSPAAAGAAGVISEPPLSPGAAPSAPLAAAPSLEAQVVRIGLMKPADVETTLKEEAETGRPFAELAVEHGHVEAADMARLAEPAPAQAPQQVAPDPEPEAAPEPVVAVEPVAAVEPDVPGAVAPASAQVFIRLTSGERIAAGTFDGADPAEGRAKELMRALDADADWPCIDGRYIRPDAVVSIDVELTTI